MSRRGKLYRQQSNPASEEVIVPNFRSGQRALLLQREHGIRAPEVESKNTHGGFVCTGFRRVCTSIGEVSARVSASRSL